MYVNNITNLWQLVTLTTYVKKILCNQILQRSLLLKTLYTVYRANDEGSILKTSAFQIFHGGNSTFISSFDKTKVLFHSPNDATPQFL